MSFLVHEEGNNHMGQRKADGYDFDVQVALRFNKQLHTLANRIAGLKFNVRFSIKRTGFVFMHEALDAAQGGAMAGLRHELLLPPPDARSVPGTHVQVRFGMCIGQGWYGACLLATVRTALLAVARPYAPYACVKVLRSSAALPCHAPGPDTTCRMRSPVSHSMPLQIPSWRNPNVGSNPEQAQAVRCVVSGTSGKLPFIIWGPPGTGKTSTLVEAAAQVRMLMCALASVDVAL